MARIVKFPDGTRVAASMMTNWVAGTGASSSVITMNLNGTGSSQYYTYTFQNSAVANAALNLIDAWYFNPNDTLLDVLNAVGVAIFTLGASSGAHGSTFGVTVTGQQFQDGCKITIGGVDYTTVFTDAGDLSFNYTGNLPAGTYDVTVTNLLGTSFTWPQSFTLT